MKIKTMLSMKFHIYGLLPVILFSLILFPAGCAKKDKVVSQKSILKINAEPAGARISINGKAIGSVPIALKVSPGPYIIKLEKEDYKTLWEKILCSPGSKKEVNLKLEPVTSCVLIDSLPSKAQVEIDGKVFGETPLVLYDQPIGRHSAELKKYGHTPVRVEWRVTDERPRHVVGKLASNQGELSLRSVPANAAISIDGKVSGQTPFSGSLHEGKHTVKFSKSGYAEHQEVVVIQRGKKVSKTVRLTLLPGTLSIKTTPPGAEVYINDKRTENSPADIKGLAPGPYKIKIMKEGFDTVEREIEIKAGQQADISETLSSNTGKIQLVTVPSGVSVYIDGKLAGKTQKGEYAKISQIFEIKNISAGFHVLTFAHKRAVPNKKHLKIKLKKGETKRLKNVKMWIADAVLVLKTGERYEGRLTSENTDFIMFEVEPGVTVKFDWPNIRSLNKLAYKED